MKCFKASLAMAASFMFNFLFTCSAQSATYNVTWDFRNAKSKENVLAQAASNPYFFLFDPNARPLMKGSFAENVRDMQQKKCVY